MFFWVPKCLVLRLSPCQVDSSAASRPSRGEWSACERLGFGSPPRLPGILLSPWAPRCQLQRSERSMPYFGQRSTRPQRPRLHRLHRHRPAVPQAYCEQPNHKVYVLVSNCAPLRKSYGQNQQIGSTNRSVVCKYHTHLSHSLWPTYTVLLDVFFFFLGRTTQGPFCFCVV